MQGVACTFPNTTVNVIRSPPWETLLSRIGDDLMFSLLRHHAVLQRLPNRCYMQVSCFFLPTLLALCGKHRPSRATDVVKDFGGWWRSIIVAALAATGAWVASDADAGTHIMPQLFPTAFAVSRACASRVTSSSKSKGTSCVAWSLSIKYPTLIQHFPSPCAVCSMDATPPRDHSHIIPALHRCPPMLQLPIFV